MKIAYIYDAVYPWVKGGAEKRTHDIAKRLVRKGHEIHWFGLTWWYEGLGEKDIEYDGIFLHRVCSPLELYVDGKRSIEEAVAFGIALLPPLLRERFDIIDCQEFPYFSCFAAKSYSMLRRSPLVITWHELWADYWYEYLGRRGIIGKFIEQVTARLASANIAVSEATGRRLQSLVKNVEIIPNGLDFHDISRTPRSSLESDVIFAGRLIQDKNVDLLLRAMQVVRKKIANIRCFIIGDGPERSKLESLTTHLGLERNLEFFGFIQDHREVLSLMKAAKVFVLPSTREGSSIVAMEANACGLPVITIDHYRNAARELIEPGINGLLCGLSAEEIGAKIVAAFDMNLRDHCIERAKAYDWDIIVTRYETYLRHLL
nr:glycosyltransferase family 4 protein [Candidatus Njordarchaeum guaymaensis]